MTSTLTTATDYYLFIIPAVFGIVFAFVVGLAVYQCSTFCRVKHAYERRNRVLRSRLKHTVGYCEVNNIPEVYDTLRDLGYEDLQKYSSSSSDSDADDRRSKRSASRADVSMESTSMTPEKQSRKSHQSKKKAHREHQGGADFVLDEVHMYESDDARTYES